MSKSKETALSTKYNPKKSIMIVTQDNIRSLPIPKQKQPKPILFTTKEFEKSQALSVYLSPEKMQSMRKEVESERDEKQKAAQERKEKYTAIDVSRNNQVSDIDKDIKIKSQNLLEKANKQLCEQDDDIKALNELILNAKCVAIRDLQVEEKQKIKLAIMEEEIRLDMIMEHDRVKDLERIRKREEKRLADLKHGASLIRAQIDQRHEQSIMDQEKRDNESKANSKLFLQQLEFEKSTKQAKILKQKQMMQAVLKYNQDSQVLKLQSKQNELDEDKKILEYILQKEKDETIKEKLMKEKAIEREAELTRLRFAQQKMTDKQQHQDALRSQRAHEAYEREWRRKEKDQAEKARSIEEEIKQSRSIQQRDRENLIAEEAYALRIESLKSIEKQKEIQIKLVAQKHEKESKAKQFSKDIKEQINIRSEIKKKNQIELLNDAFKLEKLNQEKLARLDLVKREKIQDLRKMGVPEKYLNDIARKAGIQQ